MIVVLDIFRRFFAHQDFARLFMVISWDSVPPPELTRNAPIIDIFHPSHEHLLKTLRDETHFILALLLVEESLGKRLHLHEPLFAQHRFDDRAAALAVADVMDHLLDFDKMPGGFYILDERFPALVTVHADVFPGFLVHLRFFVEHLDEGETVFLA